MVRSGRHIRNITHVHIFEEPVSQDAATTAALLIDVCNSLPYVNQIHLYSDNAGCYKSTTTIALLHQELGKRLNSYDFCEAQDGKGPCDRKASHIKSAIKRHVNEENDVTTAHQMKEAIDSQQKGMYKVKVISQIIDADIARVAIKNIPSISSLHNFKFTERGLQIWRAYEIGEGKMIPWDNICKKKNPLMQFHVHVDWPNTDNPPGGSTDSDDDSEDEDIADENDEDSITDLHVPLKKRRITKKVFTCPEEGCARKFRNSLSLDKRIMTGNCDIKEEKLSVSDRSKTLCAQKLEDGKLEVSFTKHSAQTTNISTSKLKKGWALKVPKPKTLFTEDQKLYLQEKFNIGETTGRKEDPSKVAEDMRHVKENGVNRFPRAQFLTSQQIASFFSRLVQKEKKLDVEDLEAVDVDIKCEKLKQDILEKCTL